MSLIVLTVLISIDLCSFHIYQNLFAKICHFSLACEFQLVVGCVQWFKGQFLFYFFIASHEENLEFRSKNKNYAQLKVFSMAFSLL